MRTKQEHPPYSMGVVYYVHQSCEWVLICENITLNSCNSMATDSK